MDKKYICLMQPHFLPAFSYFELISKVNKFIFLTDVQLSRQSFQTRNRILISDEVKWINSSISRKSSSKLIRDAEFSDLFWKATLLRKLKLNYAKCQYKNDLFEVINFIDDWDSLNLCEFNIGLIKFIVEKLNINTELLLDTSLKLPSHRGARIINLMNINKNYIYVYSPGSKEYMMLEDIFDSGFKCAEFKYNELYYETKDIRLSFIEALATFGWAKLKLMLGNYSEIRISSI